MLEPVSALTGMLMAARAAKFEDSSLTDAVAHLDTRVRATKSADTASWIAIYDQALGLIDRIVKNAEGAVQPGAADQARAQANALREVVSSVQEILSKTATDWSPRLATQEQELSQKGERSVKKLPITSAHDPKSGEMVFHVDPTQLQGFSQWLDASVQSWFDNDTKLTQNRTNEAIAPLLKQAGEAVKFEVTVPVLKLPLATKLESPKVPQMMPGTFDALGKTFKAVTGSLMGVTGLTFGLQRLVSNPGLKSGLLEVLPYLSGVGVLGMVIYALVSVPKQHRQNCARIVRASEERVHKELTATVGQRIRVAREALGNGLKKHLSDETLRWKQVARPLTGELPSNPGPIGPAIPPKTLERMQGEWRDAMKERLAVLRA